MKKLTIGLSTALLLLGGPFAFAEDTAPPAGQGVGSTNQQPPPPPPPSQSSTQGQMPPPQGQMPPPQGQGYQRDGANYQKDGANYQKDGPNFQKDGPSSQEGSSTQSRQWQWQPQSQSSTAGVSSSRDKQQVAQNKRAASGIQSAVTALTKAQTKVAKAGFALTSDCTTALADAQSTLGSLQSGSTEVDQSDIQDTMQSLMQCKMIAQQLVQAPTIMKAITRTYEKLKKKGVLGDSDPEDYATLQSEYATLKAGGYGDDDVYAFFDDARSLAESLGMSRSAVPALPHQEQNGGMGAAALGAWRSFTKSLGF